MYYVLEKTKNILPFSAMAIEKTKVWEIGKDSSSVFRQVCRTCGNYSKQGIHFQNEMLYKELRRVEKHLSNFMCYECFKRMIVVDTCELKIFENKDKIDEYLMVKRL